VPYLSDDLIRQLPRPAKGNKVHFDQPNLDVAATKDVVVAGLGVRITAAGHRAFVLDYRLKDGSGTQRRLTLGRFPYLDVERARKRARALREQIEEGKDPQGEKAARRAAPTVSQLANKFESEHVAKRRQKTRDDYEVLLRLYIRPAIGTMKIADVQLADVKRMHDKITAAGHLHQANRAVAVTSSMFSFAIREGLRADGVNPASHVQHNREGSRKRYLKPEELAAIATELARQPDTPSADVIKLLLFTGARFGEVTSMRWRDLDLGDGIWSRRAADLKQGIDHEVPLSAPARQLLSRIYDQQTAAGTLGEFVFASRESRTKHVVNVRKLWRALLKTTGIGNLRPHDLRHSYASQFVSSGASLPLIGALLGHSSPATTARYAHMFRSPMMEATERVGAVIEAAMTGKQSPDLLQFPGKGKIA
jgi:integrase